MSECVMDAALDPERGRAGERVRIAVRITPEDVVHSVRLAVVGYPFEEALYSRGGEWVAEATVPYEAGPGEYPLEVYALDAGGRRCGSGRVTFTVLA